MSKINNNGSGGNTAWAASGPPGSSAGPPGSPSAGSYSPADLSSGNYGNKTTWNPQVVNMLSSGQGSGTTFWSMNGYVLANNPTFEMCLNDQVIWYVAAYGSMSHVFHLHGHSVSHNDNWEPSVSK